MFNCVWCEDVKWIRLGIFPVEGGSRRLGSTECKHFLGELSNYQLPTDGIRSTDITDGTVFKSIFRNGMPDPN